MINIQTYKSSKHTGYSVTLTAPERIHHNFYLCNGNFNLDSMEHINIGKFIAIAFFKSPLTNTSCMTIFTNRIKNQTTFFQHLIATYNDKILNQLSNMTKFGKKF